MLNLSGFRDGQGILKFNTQVADCAVHLGVAEKELNGAQVAGLLVDLGDLCTPHRMLAICARL